MVDTPLSAPYIRVGPDGLIRAGPGHDKPPAAAKLGWPLPDGTAAPPFDLKELQEYISILSARKSPIAVTSYAHGAENLVNGGAYEGGVLSPLQNRIYLMPAAQSPRATWHYIDCDTGNVVGYINPYTTAIVISAYNGGVYCPIKNRIYLVPYRQTTSPWHYIDCVTGAVEVYTHSASTVGGAYSGGVYSPLQKRIYFVPSNQAFQAVWHYIDCATGQVIEYSNPYASEMSNESAYSRGVYSPTQNRIYFVPAFQSSSPRWHYIDCANGAVKSYAHASSAAEYYSFGVYSPTQNRIYLAPSGNATESTWHYIDCTNGAVVGYQHGMNMSGDNSLYYGAVYSPLQNRIYLVPYYRNTTTWHYIDCDTGAVVEYAHKTANVDDGAYAGGVFCPTQNRIYFVPAGQVTGYPWHYIADLSDVHPSRSLMAGAIFNNS